MPNLIRLDLSDNRFSVQDLTFIFEPAAMPPAPGHLPGGVHDDRHEDLPGLCRLQELNLSKNELCGPLNSILEPLSLLTRLDLSDTTLRAANAAQLGVVLSRMTHMRWLNIGGNRITQRAAAPLGAAFAQMHRLEHLNASGHVLFNFGPDGMLSPLHMHAAPRGVFLFQGLP